MKKIPAFFPLFLALLICLISFRFLLLFSYTQIQKADFRKQLVLKDIREIKYYVFSQEDIFKDKNGCEWKEQNKELIIEGVYYEVMGFTKKNGFITVALIEDKNENALFQNYFALDKTHKGGIDLIKHLMSLTYIQPHFNLELKNNFFEITQLFREVSFTTSNYAQVGIKPPERLISIA